MSKEEWTIENIFRVPFDQYQRYRLLSEAVLILEDGGPLFCVLEVGGYPPKIHDFLPGRKIMVVDKQKGPGKDYLQAEGTNLPFPDGHFDLVVSLDTIEHVMVGQRELFISELCRVARSCVIVAAPFASDAVKAADRAIFEFIREHAGYDHPFLKEHLEIEAPDMEATRDKMAGHGLEVEVIPSGRLDRWLLMMAIYYTLDSDPDLCEAAPSVMEAYNRAFYDFDKAEPAYRHMLIGAREGLGNRRDRLAELVSGEAAEGADFNGLSTALELARTLALKAKDKEREALQAELAAREDEVKSLREHISELENFTKKVKSLPLYPLYEKFIKPRKKP